MPMDREAVRDGILDAVYLIALAGGAGYVLFKYVFTRDILFWLLGFLPVPIASIHLGHFLVPSLPLVWSGKRLRKYGQYGAMLRP